jgi:hypothetical protein
MKGPTQQYSAGGGGDDIPLARVRFALRIWTRWNSASAELLRVCARMCVAVRGCAWLCVGGGCAKAIVARRR